MLYRNSLSVAFVLLAGVANAQECDIAIMNGRVGQIGKDGQQPDRN
jgi:hypothetical protein